MEQYSQLSQMFSQDIVNQYLRLAQLIDVVQLIFDSYLADFGGADQKKVLTYFKPFIRGTKPRQDYAKALLNPNEVDVNIFIMLRRGYIGPLCTDNMKTLRNKVQSLIDMVSSHQRLGGQRSVLLSVKSCVEEKLN